jgi:hypothetical protein
MATKKMIKPTAKSATKKMIKPTGRRVADMPDDLTPEQDAKLAAMTVAAAAKRRK